MTLQNSVYAHPKLGMANKYLYHDFMDADHSKIFDDEGLIRFWHESGVDLAYDDEPNNHLVATPKTDAKQPRAPQREALRASSEAAPASLAMATAPNLDDVIALAQSASTLGELKSIMETFDGCALKQTATQLVFSDGNPDAKIMLIGEAPSRDEDVQGTPFAGKSGELLDKMLAAIGLDRQSTYLTNIVPWRPPANRAPSIEEVAIFLPFLHRHIQLMKPDMIVLVGGFCAKTMLNTQEGIMRVRGQWKDCDVGLPQTIPAIAMLHPSYLLRNPSHKRLAWEDLLKLKAQTG